MVAFHFLSFLQCGILVSHCSSSSTMKNILVNNFFFFVGGGWWVSNLKLMLICVNLCHSDLCWWPTGNIQRQKLWSPPVCVGQIICCRNTDWRETGYSHFTEGHTHAREHTPLIRSHKQRTSEKKRKASTAFESYSLPLHIQLFVEEGWAVGVLRETPVEVHVRQVDLSDTSSGLYISCSLHTHTHLCRLTTTPGKGRTNECDVQK